VHSVNLAGRKSSELPFACVALMTPRATPSAALVPATLAEPHAAVDAFEGTEPSKTMGTILEHLPPRADTPRVKLTEGFRFGPNCWTVPVRKVVAHSMRAKSSRPRTLSSLQQELDDQVTTEAFVGCVALRFAPSALHPIVSRRDHTDLLLKTRIVGQDHRDDRSLILVVQGPAEVLPFRTGVMHGFCRTRMRHCAVMRAHTPVRSQPERMEPLLTVDATAAFLGISRRQVYTLLEHEGLPHVRVGHRIRFVPADLRAYLERQREEPAT
jgi:excisionase family DNA binding protein